MNVITRIRFVGWEYFFGHMTGKQNKKLSLTNAKWIKLTEDIHFEGIQWAKGSEYKKWETENFGWVCFHIDALTVDGNIPGNRLFKF